MDLIRGDELRRWALPTLVVVLLGAASYFVARRTIDESLPSSTRVSEGAELVPVSSRVEEEIEPEALSDLTSSGDRKDEEIVSKKGRTYVADQIIVKFERDASETARRRLIAGIDAKRVRKLPLDAELLELERLSINEAAQRLANSPLVAFAEPNFIFHVDSEPNDSYYEDLWGLSNGGSSSSDLGGADIDAPDAWETTTGGENVTVAVLDTGVVQDHADISGNLWTNDAEASGRPSVDDDGNGYVDDVGGWDFVDDDADPLDLHGHGTHVAGTIGAEGDNGTGITGVSWDVGIMPLRVLGADGSGSTSDIAAAITYAARSGADVVNASLSGPGLSRSLQAAIGAADDVLFVVAAGNDGRDNDATPNYPCSYNFDNIICVAATTNDDRLASFSNFGAGSVDLAAPGVRILSTVPKIRSAFKETFDDLSFWSGTWGRATDDLGAYATDSVSGHYPASGGSAFTLGDPIGVEGAHRCTLSYALQLDTEQGDDSLFVDLSKDGGAWRPVRSWSGSTDEEWLQMSEPVPFSGPGELGIRFRLEADGDGVTGDGASLDDVRLSCVAADAGDYAFFSGTSMATPHVAGTAALLKASKPGATPTQLVAALEEGTEKLTGLAGKTVSGGRLDASRALDLLIGTSRPITTPSPEASGAEPPSDEGGGGGGGGGGSGGGGSDDGAGEEPQDGGSTGSPAPQPTEGSESPSPSPSETAASETERAVSLELRRHLLARGRVTASADDARCTGGVRVEIVRRGKVVAKTVTDSLGRYRIRLVDRIGSYRARVRRAEFEDGSICSSSTSGRVRHVH